ncbi:hypothetical protein IZ6_12990 [Terrihabitans soli]|uniref:Uncharacterized protein n=1 Tax=Terrihabitans soli TaxID=708113 RepID=A0A6S6QJS5_9HYPH|nr:sigma factor [Terrihabitans soli]BCJ90564.1 hypothetical protein IZ6_12990 [Terrihabitans soli]
MSNQNELLTLHGQLLAGDARASSKIVAIAIAPLVAIIKRDVGGLHDPQDVEQACFDALFKYLVAPGGYDPQRAELMTYLAAIARGRAKTLRRSQSRRTKYEGEYALDQDSAHNPLVEGETGGEAATVDEIDWMRFGSVLVKDPGDAEIVNLMKVGACSVSAVAHALGLDAGETGLTEAAKRIERIRGRARRMTQKSEA